MSSAAPSPVLSQDVVTEIQPTDRVRGRSRSNGVHPHSSTQAAGTPARGLLTGWAGGGADLRWRAPGGRGDGGIATADARRPDRCGADRTAPIRRVLICDEQLWGASPPPRLTKIAERDDPGRLRRSPEANPTRVAIEGRTNGRRQCMSWGRLAAPISPEGAAAQAGRLAIRARGVGGNRQTSLGGGRCWVDRGAEGVRKRIAERDDPHVIPGVDVSRPGDTPTAVAGPAPDSARSPTGLCPSALCT